MKIVATSDFHGILPDEVPECDLLLIAGDVTPVWDHKRQFQAAWLRSAFSNWLREQPAKYIIGVGGNHDFVLEDSKIGWELPWLYLENERAVVDGHIIWGSPYSVRFGQWAFMPEDDILGHVWELIPPQTEILLIHGPPYGYGDEVVNRWGLDDRHVGSRSMTDYIAERHLPNLKYIVCGHIHEGYGRFKIEDTDVTVLNVSYVNEQYVPGNEPMVFHV